MAITIAEGSRAQSPTNLKLADDFAAWWSGVAWTWKPVKKKSSTPSLIRTWRSAPRPASKNSSHSSTSGGLTNVQALFQVLPYFEIRPSPKGGYGAFALEDIPSFTVILSEPALLQATNADVLYKFELLSQTDKETFMQLASFDKVDPNKVIAIFKTNRFQVSGPTCGIFPISSRFNHACFPLCSYLYNARTQLLVLETKAPISKDQEMTISYGCTGDDLLYNWGFVCDCGRCNPTGNVEKW